MYALRTVPNAGSRGSRESNFTPASTFPEITLRQAGQGTALPPNSGANSPINAWPSVPSSMPMPLPCATVPVASVPMITAPNGRESRKARAARTRHMNARAPESIDDQPAYRHVRNARARRRALVDQPMRTRAGEAAVELDVQHRVTAARQRVLLRARLGVAVDGQILDRRQLRQRADRVHARAGDVERHHVVMRRRRRRDHIEDGLAQRAQAAVVGVDHRERRGLRRARQKSQRIRWRSDWRSAWTRRLPGMRLG